MTRAKHCSWLAAAIVALAPPASAGESDAATLFAEGRKLRLGGDCAGAIVRFRQALEAYPEGLGSLRNIAECQQQLGLDASARRSWWDLRRGALKSSDPDYDGWEEDAERAHAALEQSVPRVTIKLIGGKLEGVRVLVDDAALPRRLWGVPIERDVGEHRIRVWYGEPEPFERMVDLTRGAREVVTFTIPEKKERVVEQKKPVVVADDGETLRIGGYVAFGIGGLAAVGFGAALGVRQAALDDLDAVCTDYDHCPPEADEPHERGTTASLLVNVFGAVAGVGLASGIVLVVVGSTTGAQERARTTLTPTAGGALLRTTVAF